MTLTFVPKILAIFVALMITLPYMYEQMHDLHERLAERIVDNDSIADIPIEPAGAERQTELLAPVE